MSEFENQARAVSNGGHPGKAPRKSIEDVSNDHDEETPKRSNNSGSGRVELPPNENLRKNADEAYGDTEIPERKNDV
jgi:hypothetical protein